MFIAWLSDESIEDGILWNVKTAAEAADKHVDKYALPIWSYLGSPKQLRVRVQKHDEDDPPIETYDFDINVKIQRSAGKFLGKI